MVMDVNEHERQSCPPFYVCLIKESPNHNPVYRLFKARYTWCKFCIQVSIQENFDQENLNSSLCIHDARNFDEYTQVLAGDTTNKMAFLGGEEGAALCIALLCTIVLRRRLSSNKRSTWARKWLRRRRQRSIYSNLVQELREEDPDEYLKYLRMTTTTFNILLEKVRWYIEKKNTVMRNSISAAERLTCSCYYLHSQADADKDSVFWLVNLHPSSIQVERKIGCISIPSKSIQVFWFKFLVWYTR